MNNTKKIATFQGEKIGWETALLLRKPMYGFTMRDCCANSAVLKSEINYWSQQRNKAKKKINWSFTRKDADKK
ncbi:MAG: hypothetical protein KKD86_12855, partial [Bacteroidetes bacterium]|nr:hypothetical protein [Bacteroidota bacterium]